MRMCSGIQGGNIFRMTRDLTEVWIYNIFNHKQGVQSNKNCSSLFESSAWLGDALLTQWHPKTKVRGMGESKELTRNPATEHGTA